ncbi:HU family DNA-binding protein [Aquifex sp.]
MNKKQLSRKIYEKVKDTRPDTSRKEVYECVVELFKIIQEALLRGEKVKVSGFGTLMVKTRKPKKGMNIREGKVINVPERKVVVFKPSKSFIKVGK